MRKLIQESRSRYAILKVRPAAPCARRAGAGVCVCVEPTPVTDAVTGQSLTQSPGNH